MKAFLDSEGIKSVKKYALMGNIRIFRKHCVKIAILTVYFVLEEAFRAIVWIVSFLYIYFILYLYYKNKAELHIICTTKYVDYVLNFTTGKTLLEPVKNVL